MTTRISTLISHAAAVVAVTLMVGCTDMPTSPEPTTSGSRLTPIVAHPDLVAGSSYDTAHSYLTRFDGNSGNCNGGGDARFFEVRMFGLRADGTQASYNRFDAGVGINVGGLGYSYIDGRPHENTRESVNTDVLCHSYRYWGENVSRVGTHQFFYDDQGQWVTLCNNICATWTMDWVPAYYNLSSVTVPSSVTVQGNVSVDVPARTFASIAAAPYLVEVFNGSNTSRSRHGLVTLPPSALVPGPYGRRWSYAVASVVGDLAGVDTVDLTASAKGSTTSPSASFQVIVQPGVGIVGPTTMQGGTAADFTASVAGCNPTCSYLWYVDDQWGTRTTLGTGRTQTVSASIGGGGSFTLTVRASSNGTTGSDSRQITVYSSGGGGGGGGCSTDPAALMCDAAYASAPKLMPQSTISKTKKATAGPRSTAAASNRSP